MASTAVFCPNWNCPARGHLDWGNIGIHVQKEQRFICHACHPTFSARSRFMCRCLAGHHRSGGGVLHGHCNASSSDGAHDHDELWGD